MGAVSTPVPPPPPHAPHLPPPPPPGPARASRTGPGFWWRVLSPVGAVLVALVVLVALAGVLAAAGVGDDALGATVTFTSSLLLLCFGVALWRMLPRAERRVVLAPKRSRVGAVLLGLNVGAGIVIGGVAIIALGQLVEPGVEDRLEDVQRELGAAPWQVARIVVSLVVLAPLGEELLFRGLLLRGLVRRMRFPFAAVLSGTLFAAAHADAYVIWPRAIALVITGAVLAWLYRWRGYPASVAAHFTVNAVAAVALAATS